MPAETPLDALEIRCPKLGMLLTFGYCRKEAGGLPCSRALVCWASRFPVDLFFSRLLPPEVYRERFEHPPKPKLASILELADQARKAPPPSKDSQEK